MFRAHNRKLRRMPRMPEPLYQAFENYLCGFAYEDPEWFALTIHGMFAIGEAQPGDPVRQVEFEMGPDGKAKRVDANEEQHRLFSLFRSVVLLPEIGPSGRYAHDYDCNIAMTLVIIVQMMECCRRLWIKQEQAKAQSGTNSLQIVASPSQPHPQPQPQQHHQEPLDSQQGDASSSRLEQLQQQQQQEQQQQQLNQCVCGKEGAKTCSRCRTARYCSSECQKTDWPTHKLTCGVSNTPTSTSEKSDATKEKEDFAEAEKVLMASIVSRNSRNTDKDGFYTYSGHAKTDDIPFSKLLAEFGISSDGGASNSTTTTTTTTTTSESSDSDNTTSNIKKKKKKSKKGKGRR